MGILSQCWVLSEYPGSTLGVGGWGPLGLTLTGPYMVNSACILCDQPLCIPRVEIMHTFYVIYHYLFPEWRSCSHFMWSTIMYSQSGDHAHILCDLPLCIPRVEIICSHFIPKMSLNFRTKIARNCIFVKMTIFSSFQITCYHDNSIFPTIIFHITQKTPMACWLWLSLVSD